MQSTATHPTCWASSQWSHTVSSTPCHGAWTPVPLSAHPSMECRCTASQIDTRICTAAQLVSSSGNNIRAAHYADNPTRIRIFIPETCTHPDPGVTLPRRAWVRLKCLHTGVGSLRSCLYKWGMACECGAEEQTVDHAVLQCPIHRGVKSFLRT